MSIEYTYPEQKPFKAKVSGTDQYSLTRLPYSPLIKVAPDTIDPSDVPEVCEAMMRLAGHEWPHLMSNEADNIQKNAERQMAERIIARLEKADTPTGVYVSSWGLGIDRAIRIVREECGL